MNQPPFPPDAPRPNPSTPIEQMTQPEYDELADLLMIVSGALSIAVADGCVTDLTLTQRQVDILWYVDHYAAAAYVIAASEDSGEVLVGAVAP